MLHLLTDPKHSVNSVCFSADGDLLVSGSDDTTLKIWSKGSSGNFECKSTLNVDGSISSLDFSPCGTKIAAACNDYRNDVFTVKILSSSSESAGTFECESTLTGHTGNPESSVSCLAAIQAHFIRDELPPFFGEEEGWMGLEDDDLISKDHLQELLSDPHMNLTEADIELLHVDALFDYLLSLDASQGELVKKDVFNKALEQADTSTVVYNPNPRLLCTLNVDGQVSSLDFSPCGTKIAVACNDHGNDVFTVKILSSSSESAGTFECQSTLTGHTRYVPAFSCSACSQSRGVCSLSSDAQHCLERRV